MSRLGNYGQKLYSGEISYNIVGNRRRWYAISGVIFLIAVVSFVSLIFFASGRKKNSEMEMEVNQTKLELNVTAGEKKVWFGFTLNG